MNFTLNKTQLDYLSQIILQNQKDIQQQLNVNKILKKGLYKLSISLELADEIRELCLELLPKVGFDENYNLNQDGKIIQDLIDLFYC